MLRRLGMIARGVLAIAAVALVVLCVRSYWWRDLLWARVPNFGSGSLASLDGKLRCTMLWESTESANARFAWGFSRMTADEATLSLTKAHVQHRWSRYGFELVNYPNPIALALPDWYFAPPILLMFYLISSPRLLHFSVRTLLIATTLVAVVLGLAVWAGQ